LGHIGNSFLLRKIGPEGFLCTSSNCSGAFLRLLKSFVCDADLPIEDRENFPMQLKWRVPVQNTVMNKSFHINHSEDGRPLTPTILGLVILVGFGPLLAIVVAAWWFGGWSLFRAVFRDGVSALRCIFKYGIWRRFVPATPKST